MATRRYESYGNRYFRSRTVRIGLGGQTALCSYRGGALPACNSVELYGDPGASQLMRVIFEDGTPEYLVSGGLYYELFSDIAYRTCVLKVIEGANTFFLQRVNTNGYETYQIGSPTVIDMVGGAPEVLGGRLGFVDGQAAGYSIPSISSVQYPNTLAGPPSFPIPYEPKFPFGTVYFSTRNWSGEPPGTPFYHTPPITTAPYIATPGDQTVDITREGILDFAEFGTVSGRSWRLNVYKADGTKIGTYVGNYVPSTFFDGPQPQVEILQGDGSYTAQSQRYPEWRYNVSPTSCECGDFQQETIYPKTRIWVGSQAGPFSPCKHMMALNRLLGTSQNYTDYYPYSTKKRVSSGEKEARAKSNRKIRKIGDDFNDGARQGFSESLWDGQSFSGK